MSAQEKKRVMAYKLDCNLLVVKQIGTLKDDTKGALADLLADAIMNADDVGGGGRHYGGLSWPIDDAC